MQRLRDANADTAVTELDLSSMPGKSLILVW